MRAKLQVILTHQNYRQQFECLATRFATANFSEQQVVHTRIVYQQQCGLVVWTAIGVQAITLVFNLKPMF